MRSEENFYFESLIHPQRENFEGVNVGYLGAAVSFIFLAINTHYLLPSLAPTGVRETNQKFWKWKNTVNSLLHSCITGVGSLLNLWLTPELRVDLISVHTTSSVIINSISVGYFIYDFLDLARNNLGKKNTTELLIHHVLVTICFGLALVTQKYQGYAMVSLLLEVNSIFLHIRQLFIIHNVSKTVLAYKITSYANIATFLVFRLLPLSWQVRWLIVHKDEVPGGVVILGFITSAIIMILNIGLLTQIVKKDFVYKESKKQS